jgi:hypothetical protein
MAESKQRLIEAIRGWIHMDNLLENHSAQAANARNLRGKHEQEAITLMKQMNLERSTIQVSGGSLTLQQKTAPAALTWGYLEKEVPEWAAKNGVTATQTASLIRWLHDRREVKATESLKKSGLKKPADKQ